MTLDTQLDCCDEMEVNMGKIADATFKGKNGNYDFEVYPVTEKFDAIGAIYAFTRREIDKTGKGRHTFVYIGRAKSLRDQIPEHEKWPWVKKYGINCICVHCEQDERLRMEKELDLRASFDMTCIEN